MRNRIIIVVLGLLLGFGARYGVDLYRDSKDTSKAEPSPAVEKAQSPVAPPKTK